MPGILLHFWCCCSFVGCCAGAGIWGREGEIYYGPGLACTASTPCHRKIACQPPSLDWPESPRCTLPVSSSSWCLWGAESRLDIPIKRILLPQGLAILQHEWQAPAGAEMLNLKCHSFQQLADPHAPSLLWIKSIHPYFCKWTEKILINIRSVSSLLQCQFLEFCLYFLLSPACHHLGPLSRWTGKQPRAFFSSFFSAQTETKKNVEVNVDSCQWDKGLHDSVIRSRRAHIRGHGEGDLRRAPGAWHPRPHQGPT